MTRRPTILRRALATLLAVLAAIQPIGAISPGCANSGWMTGQGACCCTEPAPGSPVRAMSCCSVAQERARSGGVAVTAAAKRCGCEVNAPTPPPALPGDARARGTDGSTHSLFRWIDRGAEISAATLVLSTASPPGEPGAAPPGVRPLVPVVPATSVASSPRGLLAVTCVARC